MTIWWEAVGADTPVDARLVIRDGMGHLPRPDDWDAIAARIVDRWAESPPSRNPRP